MAADAATYAHIHREHHQAKVNAAAEASNTGSEGRAKRTGRPGDRARCLIARLADPRSAQRRKSMAVAPRPSCQSSGNHDAIERSQPDSTVANAQTTIGHWYGPSRAANRPPNRHVLWLIVKALAISRVNHSARIAVDKPPSHIAGRQASNVDRAPV